MKADALGGSGRDAPNRERPTIDGAIFRAPCGCEFSSLGSARPGIAYCPTHAAAPEMATLLREAMGDGDLDLRDWNPRARALVARIDGPSAVGQAVSVERARDPQGEAAPGASAPRPTPADSGTDARADREAIVDGDALLSKLHDAFYSNNFDLTGEVARVYVNGLVWKIHDRLRAALLHRAPAPGAVAATPPEESCGRCAQVEATSARLREAVAQAALMAQANSVSVRVPADLWGAVVRAAVAAAPPTVGQARSPGVASDPQGASGPRVASSPGEGHR